MDAKEILSTLVTRYPGLLPWTYHELTPEAKEKVIKELTILVGSWDQVSNYMPPECGHSACHERWVATGESECVAPVVEHEGRSYRNPKNIDWLPSDTPGHSKRDKEGS